MKKILPIALFSFIIFTAAAWSIGWFVQASSVKKQFETAMNGMNPSMGTVRAESMATSGFPTKLTVTLTNPSATINLKPAFSEFYKRSMAAAGNSAGVLAVPEYPDHSLEYKLTGTMTLSINPLSDHIQTTIQGNDTITLVSKESTLAIRDEYEGATHCRMQLKRGAMSAFNRLWSFNQLFTKEILEREVTAMDCTFPSVIATDANSNQLLFSLAPSHIALTSTPSTDRMNVGLAINIKDYEVMPAGDSAYAAIMQSFMPVGDIATFIQPSLLGKQTMLMDMAIDAPKDAKMLETSPLSIALKQGVIENAAGKTTMTLRLTSNPQSDVKQGELEISLVADTTPKQTEIARAMLPQLIHEFLKDPKTAAIAGHYDRTKLAEALFDALPNITQLGTLTEKLHLTFNVNQKTKQGSGEIKALEFSTRDYGIIGSGTSNIAEGQMIPSMKAELTCKNCIAMLDTLANYLKRVDAAFATLEPKNLNHFAPPPAQLAAIKALVGAVGTASSTNAADLTFAITSEAGNVNINGKNTQELMTLVQQYFPPTPAQ